MNRLSPPSETNRLPFSYKIHIPKPHGQQPRTTSSSSFSLYSPKLSLLLLAACAALFILIHIQSLHPQIPQNLIHQFQNVIAATNCTREIGSSSAAARLSSAVTFLPLKDLRYAREAQNGHTWFMSSMYDTREQGEVQYQRFPSAASDGRILCLRGRDTHDGAWNSYALAWPDALPQNAALMKGTTYVSYNHYNYDNIWHGLSAMVPFVAWHIKTGCSVGPTRWILYHWGELRTKMGPWLMSLMEATFDGPIHIEGFDNWASTAAAGDNGESSEGEPAACFEEAVVMRHNEGGMSRQRRLEVYDLMRCKARLYCNLTGGRGGGGQPAIGMTMFMRTGPRSFKNETAVTGIFERECQKIEGCQLRVAYSNNLSFCEQVQLMSLTDILISPHGAQLTNMFLMDRNSSVMEFFPKGWLKLAGVGQYVYHWIASWSGMLHRGAWRDPLGNGDCPYPEDDRRCMSVYKSGKIGHNETYFSDWARNVLTEVSIMKKKELEEGEQKRSSDANGGDQCVCGS